MIERTSFHPVYNPHANVIHLMVHGCANPRWFG